MDILSLQIPSIERGPFRRLRMENAIGLIEQIRNSPMLYPEYDARLLALLSDMKDRLESCKHSDLTNISFDHVRDILQEADAMVQDEKTLRLVDLAVLSVDNGPLLLEMVLRHKFGNVAKRLIGEYLEFVAAGKFIWLLDLQIVGFSQAEMFNLAELAETAGPWLTDDETDPEGEIMGGLDTNLHQPNCVHAGGTTLDQLQHLEARIKVDWQQLALDRNQLRKKIAAYCGLGGVIPDWKTGNVSAGKVIFDDMRTSVSVYVSDFTSSSLAIEQGNTESRGSSPQMLPSAETLKVGTRGHLININESQAEVIRLLEKATIRYCEAAKVIQNSKLCCSSFTLIVSRKPTEQLSAVVDMVSVSFRSLKAFMESFRPMNFITSGHYGFIYLEDLQRCSAIGERLLGTFGYSITCSAAERGLVHFSPVDCQLHVISLATQLLGLGLVFYTQGHLGPLSTFCLAEPLTEMLLLGTGNDSLYIKASLRDLACLGEMIGGPVFAFELASANKVSPDVFQLNPANTVSPQTLKVDATSFILSKTQPLPGQACEILARGVDIGDTWGPALFISEPGAAYGERLYAIEIGGGVLKAAEPENRGVGALIPKPFVPKQGLAYVKRIHDIAIEISGSGTKPFVSQCEQDYLGLIETGDGEVTGAESDSEGNSVKIFEVSDDDSEAVNLESQKNSSTQSKLNSKKTKTGEHRSTEGHLNMPVFHWSPQYGSYQELKTQPTFSCWDWLQIGAISKNLNCPLRPDQTREQSQQRLSNLGTEADFWDLSERQVAFQAGYYTLLQVGNTYARKLGRTIKQQIIEEWSLFPSIYTLNVLWGLQVSLCTGIAQRVSLLQLIQDSLLVHIEPLKYEQWHKMLPNVKAAFQGSIDIDHWIKGLDTEGKGCLIATITYVLGLLKHTGLNREGKSLSVLWPHSSNLSYGVKIPCDKRTFWARMVQDTDSCATFAAVTSSCFEGHNHNCRNMFAPSWLEGTVFLSTAVCRDITAMNLAPKTLDPWRLEEGKRYWIGKAGGDCWVLIHKNNQGEPQLFVRGNRFPKVLSHSLWKLNVLRERPDTSFVAEEVIVF